MDASHRLLCQGRSVSAVEGEHGVGQMLGTGITTIRLDLKGQLPDQGSVHRLGQPGDQWGCRPTLWGTLLISQ